MSKEFLYDGDFDSVLQQQGGKAMSQRMNPELLLDPGPAECAVEDVSRGVLADGLLIVALGKQPADRPVHPVPLAEFAHERGAEDSESYAPSLGMGDTQLKPRGVDVADLHMRGLGKSETTAKHGHEEDAREWIARGADGDESLDLTRTENPRGLNFSSGTLDAPKQGFDLTPQEPSVEGAKRVDGQIDGGGGELALGDQMEQPSLDVLIAKLIGGTPVKGRQFVDPKDIGLHGARGLLLQDQELGEAPT